MWGRRWLLQEHRNAALSGRLQENNNTGGNGTILTNFNPDDGGRTFHLNLVLNT
jgi:hypothetical protein